MIFLKTCAIGPTITLRVDSIYEEVTSEKTWANLSDNLPSILTEEDFKILMEWYLNPEKASHVILLSNTLLVSNDFIDKCVQSFDEMIHNKVDSHLKQGTLFAAFESSNVPKESREEGKVSGGSAPSRKEERKKKKKDKTFSTQGREIKTKAIKKKYKPNQKEAESDTEENPSKAKKLEFFELHEIAQALKKNIDLLQNCSDQSLDILALHIFKLVEVKFNELAQEVFSQSLSTRELARKKTHNEVQQTVNALYSNIMMFSKGIGCLEGNQLIKFSINTQLKLIILLFTESLQPALSKYLLRTLCSDLVNSIIIYVNEEETPVISTIEVNLYN